MLINRVRDPAAVDYTGGCRNLRDLKPGDIARLSDRPLPHLEVSPAQGHQLLIDAGCVRGCSDTSGMSTYHDDWMFICLSYTEQGHVHAQMYNWDRCPNPFGIDDPPSPAPPHPPFPPPSLPPAAPPPASSAVIIIAAVAAAAVVLVVLVAAYCIRRKSKNSHPANFRPAKDPNLTELGGSKMPGSVPPT